MKIDNWFPLWRNYVEDGKWWKSGLFSLKFIIILYCVWWFKFITGRVKWE